MKKYQITLKSKSPYMQHRMDDTKLDEWSKRHNLTINNPEVSQEDSYRAEYHCYRNDKGENFIPSDQIRGALINAGTFVKSKVGAQSKSMKSIVAAMFFIEEEQIIIPNFDTIDKRSAVNRNVKARIIVIRPKWLTWSASFNLIIDNDVTTAEEITSLFEFAGNNVGIGSFRPTNNGMFGRFQIESIKKIQ